MKILALSDEVEPRIYSPEVRENYGDVDLIVGCGDVPFYYLEFVVTMLNVPLYYVHGNHDHTKQYMSDGRVATKAEGGVLLDGRVLNAQGLLLAGLGGSIRYRPGAHQYTENEMRWRILGLAPRLWLNRLRFGRYLDILVTHSPPFGVHDKQDAAHRGFRVFLSFIKRFRPRYLLHGHSHVYLPETITRTQVYDTQVLNVYPYRIVEV